MEWSLASRLSEIRQFHQPDAPGPHPVEMWSNRGVLLNIGQKISRKQYLSIILTIHLNAGSKKWRFVRPSADTPPVELLKVKTPDSIPPKLWPPNSPDLNPVDYKIWAYCKFPNEYTNLIFIQIDQHLKKLLPKYKGVPILRCSNHLCILHDSKTKPPAPWLWPWTVLQQ